MSKNEWRNYAKIRDKLLNFGGIIFGGAVRDEIRHNIKATQFYKEQNEYYTNHPSEIKKNTFSYNDTKVSPDTLDRLIIPADIDVIVNNTKVDELIQFFMKNYKIQVRKVNDLSYFKKELQMGLYKLFKVELVSQFKNKFYLVKLDIITVNILEQGEDAFYEIPLNYDFDINSLFWSKNRGIFSKILLHCSKISIHNSIIIHDIYTNIENKIASMNPEFLWNHLNEMNPLDIAHKHNRIMKLKKKGWKIEIYFNIYKFIKAEKLSEDDTCMICLKNKKDITHCVNFKKCRCKSFICLECIKSEYSKLLTCPSCREVIIEDTGCLKYANNELEFYEKYIMDS